MNNLTPEQKAELLKEAEWREYVLRILRAFTLELQWRENHGYNEQLHDQAMENFVFPLRNHE